MYNVEKSQGWEPDTIPPMPTARHSPGILSLQSVLVVAGGYITSEEFVSSVEIFKPDTSQWCRTDPLPIDCYDVSLTSIGNTCYMLGGYTEPQNLSEVFYASANDLLHNAVLPGEPIHSDTHSAWKTLPNTPNYRPTAAVLANHLFDFGGNETSEGGADKREVYMYSPSTNSWIYTSDLPAPLSDVSVNMISSTEIIVIGGKCDGARMKTVYVGTLHL